MSVSSLAASSRKPLCLLSCLWSLRKRLWCLPGLLYSGWYCWSKLFVSSLGPLGMRMMRSGYTRRKGPAPLVLCLCWLGIGTSQIKFWTRWAILSPFCLQNWERRASFWYDIKCHVPKAGTALWILVKLLWWSDHPSCTMLACLKRFNSPSKNYVWFCSGITTCHSQLEAFLFSSVHISCFH